MAEKAADFVDNPQKFKFKKKKNSIHTIVMSKKHKTTFKNMPIGYFSYIEFSMILKETTAMYIRCDTIKLKFS